MRFLECGMKKTLTFAVLHFTVAFTLAYLLTGDVILGSLIAMIEPMVNTIAFYFHDRAWQKPSLRARAQQAPSHKTMSFAILHFSVAFFVTYLLTGNAFMGGLMATLEPSVNTVVFYFHERFWLQKESSKFTLHCHHHDIKQHTSEVSSSHLEACSQEEASLSA